MIARWRRRAPALVVVGFLVFELTACSQPPAQQAVAPPDETLPRIEPKRPRVTVPQGTVMHVTLSSAVGSETSQVGDPLTATTTEPIVIGDRVAIPSGSVVAGRVTQVTPGKRGLKVSEKGGVVVLAFERVTTPSGDAVPMAASLTQMADSKKKTSAIIGGSAAGGAVLGRILGGRSKDAALGAVIGGGIGTAIAAGTRGKAVEIPAGTDLTLQLDEPVQLPAA